MPYIPTMSAPRGHANQITHRAIAPMPPQIGKYCQAGRVYGVGAQWAPLLCASGYWHKTPLLLHRIGAFDSKHGDADQVVVEGHGKPRVDRSTSSGAALHLVSSGGEATSLPCIRSATATIRSSSGSTEALVGPITFVAEECQEFICSISANAACNLGPSRWLPQSVGSQCDRLWGAQGDLPLTTGYACRGVRGRQSIHRVSPQVSGRSGRPARSTNMAQWCSARGGMAPPAGRQVLEDYQTLQLVRMIMPRSRSTVPCTTVCERFRLNSGACARVEASEMAILVATH